MKYAHLALACILGTMLLASRPARSQTCQVLNVPRMAPKPEAEREWIGDRHGHHRARAGITWFGWFDEFNNYAEIRVIVDPEGIDIHVHVADLYIWWIMTNGLQWGGEVVAELDQWDALEIVLDPAGLGPDPTSPLPTGGALRFLVANYPYNDPVGFPETALPHKCTRSHEGTGGAWALLEDPEAAGRIWYHNLGSTWNEDPGPSNNLTQYDNGTIYHFWVPWSSLGLTSEPPSGGVMRMMVRLYDIDDPRDEDVTGMDPPPSERGSAETGPRSPVAWPRGADPDDPVTWGTLVIYQAPYQPPAVVSETTVELSPDDVVELRDVTVGGHSFIEDRWLNGGGDPEDYSWEGCMETRFGEAGDLYIHPEGNPTHLCFFDRSLFYYDLTGVVPPGSVVTEARLRLFHFGGDSNEHPDNPNFEVRTSPVQAHRLEGTWLDLPLEQGVTWNSAPPPAENVGYGEVTPDIPDGDPPGKYVEFDVTALAARAVLRNEPLNMALYGADVTANTGKYFVASEGGWTPENRPTLFLTYGEPVDASDIPDADSCTIGVAQALFDPPGTGTPDNPVEPADLPDGGPPQSDAGPDHQDPDGDGCGCQAGARSPSGLLFLLVLLGLLRRRWRGRFID